MMLNIRNRIFIVIPFLLCLWLLFNCATEEETVRPQQLLEGINLEFVGGQIVLQNPLPRNGEEVEVIAIVRNLGNQEVKRVPVLFYIRNPGKGVCLKMAEDSIGRLEREWFRS